MAEQSPAFDALKRDIADAIQHHGKWLTSHEVITALEDALVDALELAFVDKPRGLIAAAPDLLEALRRCRTHIAGYHLRYGGSEEASELVAEFFNELQRIHKVAGDAIAKAEGK